MQQRQVAQPSTSYPSPEVILESFDLYLTIEKKHQEKENSEVKIPPTSTLSFSGFSNFIEGTISAVGGAVTAVKEKGQALFDHITGTDVKLEEIYTWLNEKMEPQRSQDAPRYWKAEEWVQFIIDLRKKGSEAQLLKNVAGQSRCCEMFFAIANYVELTMKNTEAYKSRISQLKETTSQLEKEFLLDDFSNQGALGKKLNLKLDETIIDWAYLGDREGILKAKNRISTQSGLGLLAHLLSVKEKERELGKDLSFCRELKPGISEQVREGFSENVPYVLQPLFYLIIWKDKNLFQYTNHTAEEFIRNAPNNYQVKQLAKAAAVEEKKQYEVKQPVNPIVDLTQAVDRLDPSAISFTLLFGAAANHSQELTVVASTAEPPHKGMSSTQAPMLKNEVDTEQKQTFPEEEKQVETSEAVLLAIKEPVPEEKSSKGWGENGLFGGAKKDKKDNKKEPPAKPAISGFKRAGSSH